MLGLLREYFIGSVTVNSDYILGEGVFGQKSYSMNIKMFKNYILLIVIGL